MYEIKSQRGHPLRVIKNFKFRFLRNTFQGSLWRCVLKNCSAKIFFDENNKINFEKNMHYHSPNFENSFEKQNIVAANSLKEQNIKSISETSSVQIGKNQGDQNNYSTEDENIYGKMNNTSCSKLSPSEKLTNNEKQYELSIETIRDCIRRKYQDLQQMKKPQKQFEQNKKKNIVNCTEYQVGVSQAGLVNEPNDISASFLKDEKHIKNLDENEKGEKDESHINFSLYSMNNVKENESDDYQTNNTLKSLNKLSYDLNEKNQRKCNPNNIVKPFRESMLYNETGNQYLRNQHHIHRLNSNSFRRSSEDSARNKEAMRRYNIAENQGESESVNECRYQKSLQENLQVSTRNREYDYLQNQNQSLTEEWDANYKVDRLRFLDRMIAAGNYHLLNEAQSIIEELREAKIIY